MTTKLIPQGLMAAAGLALILCVLSSDGGQAKPGLVTAVWREYTYKEALQAGLVSRADFARGKGERLCGPLPPVLTAPVSAPQGGSNCYRTPDDQGIVVLVQEGRPSSQPVFSSDFDK